MATSTYKTILDAVQSEIQGLELTAIDSTSVVVHKKATDREDTLPELPGVVIAPMGARTISDTAGTNAKDDIIYPVLVAVLQVGNQDQSTNFDRFTNWTELIIKHFIHQRLTGAATVCTTSVDPRDAFDSVAWTDNIDASGMVLRFLSRETRG